MGLSDEERLNGIYTCISSMTELPLKENYPQIDSLITELWGHLRECSATWPHWLRGGDSWERGITSKSLWGWAVAGSVSKFLDRDQEDMPVPISHDAHWFHYRCNADMALSNGLLLEIVKCYEITERYFRLVQRYHNDSVALGLAKLSTLVARIEGSCAKIIKDSPDTAYYWLFKSVIFFAVDAFMVYHSDTTRDPVARLWIDLGLESKCAADRVFSMFTSHDDKTQWFRSVTAHVKRLRDEHGDALIHREKIPAQERFDLTMLALQPHNWMVEYNAEQVLKSISASNKKNRSKLKRIDVQPWFDQILPLISNRKENEKKDRAKRIREPHHCEILDYFHL